MGETRRIEVLVRLEVLDDADIQEVISEMDYSFTHPKIVEHEIIDAFTEF